MSSDKKGSGAAGSIRRRITAYYAGVLFVVILASAVLLFFGSQTYIRHTARQDLIDAVQNGFDEINYRNDVITINEDYDTYYRGVTLVLYSESGERLKGSLPKDFPKDTPLESGTYKDVTAEGETWLVYDAYRSYAGGNTLWIRGIYNMDNRTGLQGYAVWILVGLVPLVLILAIYVGNRMTKRALKPVAEMTETARRISAGGLSERVPVGDQKDELSDLAETLNDMLGRLENTVRNEKQFSSDAAHELKTPVATILAECEYALKRGEEMAMPVGSYAPERQLVDELRMVSGINIIYEESLTQIQAQSRRMMGLITQLLQLSRSLDQEGMLEKEELDLSTICDGLVEEMQGVADRAGVRLTKEIADDILYEGDETLIIRMVMNLLSNAVKYRDPDKFDPWVRFTLEKGTMETFDDALNGEPVTVPAVLIRVADNGIGIAEDEQEKIFNRLYKVDHSRAADGGERLRVPSGFSMSDGFSAETADPVEASYGIGLSMVKWIAEAHGGRVTVESTLGEGSTFTVELPAEEDAPEKDSRAS